MVSVTSLVLFFLVAPSTSARHGENTLVGRRLNYRQPPWLAFSRAPQSSRGRHSIPRTCISGSGIGCTEEGSSKGVGTLQALALVRGGGGSDEPSISTLLMRVFLPKYARESETEEGGLDLEGGGLMRRLGRLVSGVLRKVLGSSNEVDAKAPSLISPEEGGDAAGKKKGNQQGKATTGFHLEKTYRPGNANYRIQKELKEFMANPPDNCKVSVGKNIRVWIITITGAEGTVYAGEKFRLRVAFPEDYPTKPPAVYFLQSPPPPKHQHIYTNGDICLSLLSSKDWKPNLTVMSLALSILSMLSSAKEKRIPEDNAAHAEARPGQAQQWIYHDDLC